MTKYPSSSRIAAMGLFDSRLVAALALVFSAMAVNAQGLRPSGALRLPDSTIGTAGAGGQRQADFIVAVVNSEPVTNNEVRSKLVRAEQQLSQRGGAMPPRNELARQVLERLISDKAQLQMARTSGIRVDDNAVDNAVATVAQQNQLTPEGLRARLVTEGIPYAQFRSELRDELLVTRLRQREVDSRVAVTEADIDQFLRDQEGSNDPAAIELNLVQILVPVPENATAEQLAALQARANQVAQRARAGGDFAALANEFSDAQVRLTGGQMGLRSADRYPPLFLEATQNLATGGVAGPVRSGAGFHILKVLEKKKAGVPGVNITQTRARHILLRPTPQLTEAGAVEKLLDIKKRIAAGQADFAKEAQDNSVDGSAKDGGDLGWTNPGSFVPEFEQAMNGLSPGQISDPVISRFGAHLIQVLERRVTQLSERDQRELVRGIVREKKQEEAYSLWSQEVRGRAYVEYRDPPQ